MATGLATRCTACGTVFRVVPDQLRVSEGWVRCGRCSEVFNAAATLLDLESGLPRPAPPELAGAATTAPPARSAPAAPAQAPAPSPAPAAATRDFEEARFDEHDASEPPPMPVVDDSASRFAASALPPEAEGPALAAEAAPDPRAEPEDAPPVAPSFVRQAERAARWRSRPVRLLLWLLAVAGSLGLAAQGLLEYRDLVAARQPALKPLLQALCGGCDLGAARSINDLTVESSGLVRVEKSSVYRLSVALRNRAAFEVALPALELSLTDAQGQLVARRVIRPAELGVKPATVAASRELALQATLQAATAPVAGYTIELFYP